jgi:hypothetical protein
MIELGLIIAVGLVFLLPAVVLQARRAAAQRAEARQQQQAALARQEQANRAKQQSRDDLWRNDPDRAGLSEWLHYVDHRRGPLESNQAEANAYLTRQEEEVKAEVERRGGSERVPTGHRLLVLAALIAFFVVVCVGIALDYLIFRGLHPGKFLLPLGLSFLAVLGIMTGSVIFLSAGRHKLVPAPASDYAKLALRIFGFLLAGGIALYMTAIAPYRSAGAGQQAIDNAYNTLQSAETAVPALPAAEITLDKQNLARAQAILKEAQVVDRLSAAALAFLEIPLTEGAVLGGELLAFDLARRRRDRAQQAVMDVIREITAADAQFNNRLVAELTARGHDESVIYRIVRRIGNLNAAWAGLLPSPSSLPQGGQSNSAGGPGSLGGPPTGGPVPGGPGPGVPTVPGGPAPVSTVPGGPAPVSTVPGGPAPVSTVPGGPAPVSTVPSITTIDPATGPPAMAPVVHLAPEESDLTK